MDENNQPQTDQPDKPLAQKLGFVPGDSVFVDTTPDWYSDFADKAGVEITPDLPATHAHLFFGSPFPPHNLKEHIDPLQQPLPDM
jgi:hypothetical protein